MTEEGEAVVVVPARRASTRLPGKLLLAESGRPLLAHTLQRCLEAAVPTRVLAAVDSPELAAIAAEAGAEPVLTDPDLPSGSDRVWAALADRPWARLIVNVQADEPEVEPAAIDALFGALAGGAQVATLCAPLPPEVAHDDPSAVKVVADLRGRALYFSRAPIPYPRAAPAAADGMAARSSAGAAAGPKLHIGVYGYTHQALRRFAARPPSALESVEGLEQLRFLEHGEEILLVEWPHAFAGIDTRADYEAFLGRVSQRTGPPHHP